MLPSKSSPEYPKWENLPPDLLKDVAKSLNSDSDYLSFLSVCSSWKSAATFKKVDTQHRVIHTLEEGEEEPRIQNLSNSINATCAFPPESKSVSHKRKSSPESDSDYLSFLSVCNSWNSAATSKNVDTHTAESFQINAAAFPPEPSKSSPEYPKWENLPPDLLKDVAKCLNSDSDYLSFLSVCSSWKSAATFKKVDTQHRVIHTLEEGEEEPRIQNLSNSINAACAFPPESRKRLPEYPKWEDLPSDLLKDVAKRLTSNADYIFFRSVCTSWRSAASFDNFDTQHPRVPRLLYFDENEEEDEEEEGPMPIFTYCGDLVNNSIKITNFPPPTDYPYLSSLGWVLYLSRNSVNVRLLHYIRREIVHLPGLDTFPRYEENSDLPIIRKMVLSTTPQFLIFVIWGDDEQLGFCSPGDESWSVMETWECCFSDIIYEDRKLLAVDCGFDIVECDVHGPNPTKLVKIFTFPGASFLEKIRLFMFSGRLFYNYLVKLSGKLIIVSRFLKENKTYLFLMFEIELKDGTYVEINSVGRKCLFLGLNSSISAAFPESDDMKLKHDCIYYTNTIEQGGPDTGIYNFVEDSFMFFDVNIPDCNFVIATL